jgi:hypothetical protein
VIRVKRFSVLLVVVAALAASTTGTAAQQAADPRCPIDLGYATGSEVPAPELWEPTWATFQQAILLGTKYVTYPKPLTASMTRELRARWGLVAGFFMRDRGILSPGPKRKVTGHYVATLTAGPCWDAETDTVSFVAVVSPQFKYRPLRAKNGSLRRPIPHRHLYHLQDGRIVQSNYLPGNR